MAVDVRDWAVTTGSPDANREGFTARFTARFYTSIAHTVSAPNSGYTPVELPSLAVPSNLVGLALQPMELTIEEAENMREFIAHGTAYPTIPIRNVPEGDRSILKKRPH